MCDCWLDRAGTPIASTGGAISSTGMTISGSTSTVHGQRVPGRVSSGSDTHSQIAKIRFQTLQLRLSCPSLRGRENAAFHRKRSPSSARGRRGNPVQRSTSGLVKIQSGGSLPRAWPMGLSQCCTRA